MLRAKRLDDAGVAKLKVKSKRYAVPDPELRGHYIRISTIGTKQFWTVTRDPEGKQFWRMVGSHPDMQIDDARTEAAKIIRSIRGAQPNSFEAIAEQWLKMHCAKLRPNSVAEYRRSIKRMAEAWQGRDFSSIERDDVTNLLDQIEHGSGLRTANYALQTFRALANWHQARSRHYRSPIVPKMWRGERVKRDRILTDAELCAVWKQAEANGVYGALIRLALLTAQRQDKLASMKWSDITDGVWTIATAEREKGNAGALALTKEALAIIEAQPRGDSPYVFPASGTRKGRGYVSGWSQMKRAFDAKLAIANDWTFHDLRRSARSLMSRAGVRSDIAERVMGHAIAGVEGVYDRHSYAAEKSEALQRLAATLISIVTPPPKNVRQLRKAS
jgi:integrase